MARRDGGRCVWLTPGTRRCQRCGADNPRERWPTYPVVKEKLSEKLARPPEICHYRYILGGRQIMTSEQSIDAKEVIFINERAERDYKSIPIDVRERADQAVTQLQNMMPLVNKMFTQMKGSLARVDEVILPHDTNTYRIYFLQCGYALYILDAGMKKSLHGDELPKWEVERLIDRRDRALAHYKANEDAFKLDAKARNMRRDTMGKGTSL